MMPVAASASLQSLIMESVLSTQLQQHIRQSNMLLKLCECELVLKCIVNEALMPVVVVHDTLTLWAHY